jgi:hypothetical protein
VRQTSLSPNSEKPLEIAFLSQQQLHSFNRPYQLGYDDPKHYTKVMPSEHFFEKSFYFLCLSLMMLLYARLLVVGRTGIDFLSGKSFVFSANCAPSSSSFQGPPPSFDQPFDANVTGVATRPGDLIVVATDGLFDNVELDEVNRRFARS